MDCWYACDSANLYSLFPFIGVLGIFTCFTDSKDLKIQSTIPDNRKGLRMRTPELVQLRLKFSHQLRQRKMFNCKVCSISVACIVYIFVETSL